MIAWQPAGALAARHRFRDLAAPESGNAGRLAYLAQLLHRRLTLLTQMYRALNSPGYNLTITAASILVALFIGGIEALVLVGGKLRLEGAFWSVIGSLNENLTSASSLSVSSLQVGWFRPWFTVRKGYDSLQVDRL
jgi:hypothetical protein